VCTGPGGSTKYGQLRFKNIMEVPSAFYGKLCDRFPGPLGEWDCVTLHITWERDCAALREFADRRRSEIRSWRDFVKRPLRAMHLSGHMRAQR